MGESTARVAEVLRLLLALLIRFEGLYLRPYLCPAGVATIGLGTTVYPDGTPVRLTDPPITQVVAEQLAAVWIMERVLPRVYALCPNVLSVQGIAALGDFVYNLGAGALAASTLRRRLLAGDVDGACLEMGRWVRGGGRVLPGLVLRRAQDAALLRAGGVVPRAG